MICPKLKQKCGRFKSRARDLLKKKCLLMRRLFISKSAGKFIKLNCSMILKQRVRRKSKRENRMILTLKGGALSFFKKPKILFFGPGGRLLLQKKKYFFSVLFCVDPLF